MELKDIHNVYFVGIGGIGMSALARYFHHIDKRVAGYDKTKTPLTTSLQSLGIAIDYLDSLASIPDVFKEVEGTLVVFTPAVPDDHEGLQFFRSKGFLVKKRAEVLGAVTQDTFSFAVAGTHGKTTTSCILAHLLHTVNSSFTAFLGGISEDFNSNFVFRGTDCSVVEADEFDRSFHKLYPDIACITSVDADHLDIYGSEKELEEAFKIFAKKLDRNGKLLVRNGLPIQGITYGIADGSDYTIENLGVHHGAYRFDIKTPEQTIKNVVFQKPGRHNLMNALAALAMAVEAGHEPDRLVQGLATFKGVQRRFSYQIKANDFVFIDDYAHHPTEIEAVYEAVLEIHPNRRNLVVFQPHLYSRTKDFVDGFATALAKFDSVLLLDIYPARERPIPGVTSDWLFSKIDNPSKKRITKLELVSAILNEGPEVLITLGAGDIGLEVPKIKKELAYAS